MKNFLKKIVVFVGIITAVSVTVNLTNPTPTYGDSFLGMPAWNDNVTLDGNKDQNTLVRDIATIAANILTDFTVAAAYLVLGYVIYGGFMYMSSSGDPNKAAAGKKTLTQAFIGLAIVMSAYAIFGGIRIALVGSQSLGCDPLTGNGCVSADGGSMVTNLIQWVIGISGAVAVIFVVVGAFGYITANGDPNKLQKAKTTILYAVIGLAIVALAEVITAFVSNLIRESNESQSSLKDTSIVMEIANLNKEE